MRVKYFVFYLSIIYHAISTITGNEWEATLVFISS